MTNSLHTNIVPEANVIHADSANLFCTFNCLLIGASLHYIGSMQRWPRNLTSCGTNDYQILLLCIFLILSSSFNASDQPVVDAKWYP
jgi:hypothetical protein